MGMRWIFLYIGSIYFVLSHSLQCTRFFSTNSPSLCKHIDYSFITPSNDAAELLTISSNPSLSRLPSQCQIAMQNFICSQYYLKCEVNTSGNSSSVSGAPLWSNWIYSEIGEVYETPFQRPCMSVCDSLLLSCGGYLELLGVRVNCSAKFDYSNGTMNVLVNQFDRSNNASHCNNMMSSDWGNSISTNISSRTIDSVTNGSNNNATQNGVGYASTQARYGSIVPNGICSGLVDEIYLPSPVLYDRSFTAFTGADELLGKMEADLVRYFDALPRWIDVDCQLSMRKMICGSYYPHSDLIRLGDILLNGNINLSSIPLWESLDVHSQSNILNWTVSVPSYANRDTCEDYRSKCSGFVNRMFPLFRMPNCSMEVGDVILNQRNEYFSFDNALGSSESFFRQIWMNDSVYLLKDKPDILIPFVSLFNFSNIFELIRSDKLFPVDTISDVSKFEFFGYKVVLRSFSWSMNYSNYVSDWKVQCPGEFVVPDDPYNEEIHWVEGTGCAFPCRNVLWTSSEWKIFRMITTVVPSVGLVSIIILLLFWILDLNKRKEYLMFAFGISSALATVIFVVNSSSGSSSKLCKDNAVGFRGNENALCAFEALGLTYAALASCFSWGFFSLNMFLKIVFGCDSRYLTNTELPLVFLAPLISVGIVLGSKRYGYYGYFPWCSIEVGLDILVLELPVFIVSMLSSVFLIICYWKILSDRYRKVLPLSEGVIVAARNNSKKSFISQSSKKNYNNISKMKFYFSFASIFLCTWIIIFVYRMLVYSTKTFVYNNVMEWVNCLFSKPNGVSVFDACGDHSSNRISIPFTFVILAVITGQSILVTAIFISTSSVPSDLRGFFAKYFFIDFSVKSVDSFTLRRGEQMDATPISPTKTREKYNKYKSFLKNMNDSNSKIKEMEGTVSISRKVKTLRSYELLEDV